MVDDNEPPLTSKLTRTKQRWAREGRFLTGKTSRPEEQRLPPGPFDEGLADARSRPYSADSQGALASRRLRRGGKSDLLGFCAVHGTTADKVHFRHPLRDHMVALRQPMGRVGDPRSPDGVPTALRSALRRAAFPCGHHPHPGAE